ncbi:MAG: hypothetical protein ACWGOX_15865 [Desulforhopalus sp.]
MRPDDRSGERLSSFTLVDKNGVTVDLESFYGCWLWLIFHRHLG